MGAMPLRGATNQSQPKPRGTERTGINTDPGGT
jgi:hypothetical protein